MSSAPAYPFQPTVRCPYRGCLRSASASGRCPAVPVGAHAFQLVALQIENRNQISWAVGETQATGLPGDGDCNGDVHTCFRHGRVRYSLRIVRFGRRPAPPLARNRRCRCCPHHPRRRQQAVAGGDHDPPGVQDMHRPDVGIACDDAPHGVRCHIRRSCQERRQSSNTSRDPADILQWLTPPVSLPSTACSPALPPERDFPCFECWF